MSDQITATAIKVYLITIIFIIWGGFGPSEASKAKNHSAVEWVCTAWNYTSSASSLLTLVCKSIPASATHL